MVFFLDFLVVVLFVCLFGGWDGAHQQDGSFSPLGHRMLYVQELLTVNITTRPLGLDAHQDHRTRSCLWPEVTVLPEKHPGSDMNAQGLAQALNQGC